MCIKDIPDARDRIAKTFEFKKQMEDTIVELIAKYEDETATKIDKVIFRRIGTIKISEGIYTDLTLNVN
jgi:hypothetical protein